MRTKQILGISVEDRLPDTYNSYDSYGNDLTVSGTVITNLGAACYCSQHDSYEGAVWIYVDWCHKEAGKMLDGVTHWVPIPDLIKQEKPSN